MTTIAQRVVEIQQQIPSQTRLIAVSKYATVPQIEAAYLGGARHFGESRIQDAKTKQEQLNHLEGVQWHLIGHLQTNKVKAALQQFQWIHGVDRLSVATEINRLIPIVGCAPQLLLQVKLAEDPDKFGWTREDLLAHLPDLAQLTHVRDHLVGLMTILPLGLTETARQAVFMAVADFAEELRGLGWSQIRELSMGMSKDYPEAVKAGATLIRVGNQIFQGGSDH
ncbi:MAG: YggS family pyridoxal phosphate-dependent enzyme [Pseudanabaenaceae cyanobacterium]|jgi:pyridoxal phosphate enzyme (YggS family)